MSFGVHMLCYPGLAAFLYLGPYGYYKKSQEAQDKADWENMIKAKAMDPDLFNPFTPIPFHNNPELKYTFAHVNVRNYINEHHINTKDYPYKAYFDAYDHSGRRQYLWNWSVPN